LSIGYIQRDKPSEEPKQTIPIPEGYYYDYESRSYYDPKVERPFATRNYQRQQAAWREQQARSYTVKVKTQSVQRSSGDALEQHVVDKMTFTERSKYNALKKREQHQDGYKEMNDRIDDLEQQLEDVQGGRH